MWRLLSFVFWSGQSHSLCPRSRSVILRLFCCISYLPACLAYTTLLVWLRHTRVSPPPSSMRALYFHARSISVQTLSGKTQQLSDGLSRCLLVGHVYAGYSPALFLLRPRTWDECQPAFYVHGLHAGITALTCPKRSIWPRASCSILLLAQIDELRGCTTAQNGKMIWDVLMPDPSKVVQQFLNGPQGGLIIHDSHS